MAVPSAVTGIDTFSRQLTGSWGTADSGQDWFGEDAALHNTYFTLGSLGYGRIKVNASDPLNRIVYLGTPRAADQEVLVKVKWNIDNTTDLGPVLRYKDSGNYFFVGVNDGIHQFKIGVRSNNVRTIYQTASVALSKDTWYWVRAQITGSTFRAKIWAVGVVEPGSWTVSNAIAVDDGPSVGFAGLRTQSEGMSYYVYVDTFYMSNDTPSIPSLPVTETFSKTTHNGATISDSGHLWYGSIADLPQLYGTTIQGQVPATYLNIVHNNTMQDVRGLIGPDAADVEVWCRFSANQAANTPQYRVGARASDGTASGVMDYGVGEAYCRLTYGSTTLELVRDTTVIATATLSAAPLAGEIWHIRFQAQGTAARCRAWKDGTAEPGTWQINQASVASMAATGQALLRVSYGAAGNCTFNIFDFTVTAIANTAALTTGTVGATVMSDTSIDVTASYTDDTDNDSSITIQYKTEDDTTWTTAASPSVNRTTKIFSKSITGLLPGTTYNIRFTYADPDGVNGVAQQTLTRTTTLKGTDVVRVDVATTSTLGQVIVQGHYLNDSDNDNSAVVDFRTVGNATVMPDEFIDLDGVPLDTHVAGLTSPDEVSVAAQSWAQKSATARISSDGYIYCDDTAADARYAFVQVEPIDPIYTIDVTIEVKSLEGFAGIVTRMTDWNNNYFFYYTTSSGGRLYFGKRVAGSNTTFYQMNNVGLNVGDKRSMRVVENGNSHTVYWGETESTLQFLYSATDSSLPATGAGGILLGRYVTAPKNGVVITSFKQTLPGALGSWSLSSSLSTQVNGPVTKYRQGTLSGLSNDTFYEFRVTFTDADGVRNLNPMSTIIKTPGSGIAFGAIPLVAEAYDTTAVITCNYIFDVDEDGTAVFQYRSIRDQLWTTVNSGLVTTNRGTKTFRATLNNLIPNLSYQVKATLVDPEGVWSGNTEETITFLTKGAVLDTEARGKHYLYKIYNLDGEYLNTWKDAPEPEFQWNENGGLSDLVVELPRKLSSVNNDVTMNFGNRVDVWAIDTSSRGMGANLVLDSDMDLGSWTLATSWSVDSKGGPDGSSALKFTSASTTIRTVLSETIDLSYIAPLVVQWVGRAVGGKLRLDMAAYDASDVLIGTSDDNSETIGSNWQTLRLEWLPPKGTAYVRVRVQNVGAGTMWFDKVSVLQREVLIYRGFIEAYEPSVDAKGERVEVTVYSLASQLADYYVQFLQFADIQPSKDTAEYQNQNKPPDDPSNMMKKIIDLMQADNPRCQLYYTGDSIKLTGTVAEYTFREQRAEDCFDDIRNLCPSGWHWYIDPDGLVHLRGSEHATEHVLRLNVEIMSYSNKKTVENLKNYVIVRGRKDEDVSEPDGQGTIEYRAFDQASIKRYGQRIAFIRDANIKDNTTAHLVGNGRLEEWNREEEEGRARIPDEKDIRYVGGALGGYNIEAFRPGDEIKVLDPVDDGSTRWDQFLWDDSLWDNDGSRILPQDNPIKTIRYKGHEVELNLSNRQPSSTGDHAKFMRWLRQQEAKSDDLR